MQNQWLDRPERLSRTIKSTVMEGGRKRIENAFYLPTVHHPDSYRSSDGSPRTVIEHTSTGLGCLKFHES